MIAKHENAESVRRRRPRAKSARLLLRLVRHLEQVGSLHVAAPLCGVSRAWCQEWAQEDERVAMAFERASARYTARSIRRLQWETDAVLAMSHRFVAARRCPDFREEKGKAEKEFEKAVRRLVRFGVAERPKAASRG